MIALLTGLWLMSPASAAPSAAVLALADAPMSSSHRLALARELLGRPGYEEVGLEALARLVDDPIAGADARAALAELLGKVDGRPGWQGLYRRLLEDGTSFPGRDRIVLRHAEVRLADPSSRTAAQKEIDGLLTTADPALARMIGRAYLRAGEPRRAQAALVRLDDAAGRELELVAALAGGDLARARVLYDLGVRVQGAEAALADPSPVNRAQVLSSATFVTGARRLLESAPPAEAGRALAELYRVEGRLVEASAALTSYTRAHPDDQGARASLIEVLIARHKYAEARKLAGPNNPADGTLATLATLRAAWESKRKAGFDDALDAAWRAAPSDPFVAREWAKSRLDNRKPDEAVAALAPVLDANPLDEDALGLFNLGSLGQGNAGAAVRRNLAAAAAETSPKRRAARLATAADLLTVQAEEAKQSGQVADALDPYFVSLLLDTPKVGELMGAGGLLWQAQHLEGAYALYSEALRASPRNADALLASVRLLLQLDRTDDALALVNATSSRDPRVALVRKFIENAIRARAARAAAKAGDLEEAVILWKELAREYPEEPEFLHGLGDALAGLGEHEEAIKWYRETLRLNPDDAWAALGEANSLVALRRPEEARERLAAAYPAGKDPVADAEKPKVLARSWRLTALREQAAGQTEDAFEAWRMALELDPEKFAISGLAGLYLEQDQPEVALAFGEEASSLDATMEEPVVTRALALERMGRWDEARTVALSLRRPEATSAALEVSRDLMRRLAVQQGEYFRRIGRTDAAAELLASTIASEGASADLWVATTSTALDALDCPKAVASIPEALALEPANEWALGVILRAATVCKAAATLQPVLVEADRRAGKGFAEKQLRAMEFELRVQRAETLMGEGREREAQTALRDAEAMTGHSADEWARIGGAWLALGKPSAAIESFDRTLATDPLHVPAIIGKAGALRSQVRMPAAEAHLADAWSRVRDPRVGLQLVITMIQRGEYDRASRTLAEVRTATLPPEPEPERVDAPEPLPVLPLPSGRKPGPRTWPPIPPRDLQPRWLAEAVEAVDIDLARETGVHVVVGAGAFQKPGTDGQQRLEGWYVPAEVIFPPIGLVRLSADVTAVHLSDAEDEAFGVAPSLGVATAPFRRFFATARVGTSPIGFDELNPLWFGHARLGVLPKLAVGVQTARTPVSDSLTSWAGKTVGSGDDEVFYGFVSSIWLGAYASWTPRNADLGAMVRGGWTEGWGIEPNPMVDGVAWGGVTLGSPARNVHLGGQLIAIHHERQEDGFVPGQAGYFSPPVYVSAVAEARGRTDFVGSRGRLCAALGAGPQYMDGEPTPWFGTGWALNARASAGVSWRLAPKWAVGLDGRVQTSVSEATGQPLFWHQEAALAHVTWGLIPNGPAAPSMTTVASAGAILPTTNDLCRAE